MEFSPYTRALLEDIERRIDPATEEDFEAQWQAFWDGKTEGSFFLPTRRKTSCPGMDVRPIPINDALADRETMLCHQLADLSGRLASPHAALGVRANYGTGIMTSLFGAEIFIMPRETDTLPTTRNLKGEGAIDRILDGGMPDLTGGFGSDVFAFGETWAQIARQYPKIGRYVRAYHPDTQGPLDIAELLWGCDMFYAMYDDEDKVHALLSRITDTYIAFTDKWFSILPLYPGLQVHWGWMMPCPIFLRADSGMNLSPDLYARYSLPYDRRLLEYYGSGCVHFCGRGDHYIDLLCAEPHLCAFQASQMHLNDPEKLLSAARSHGKRILGAQKKTLADCPSLSACRGLLQSDEV